ncbi:MAG TPA: MFS transporter [Desulfobacteraceae bacterium]|nr:MFS transporter [Desulfobacteraceae bacterium]
MTFESDAKADFKIIFALTLVHFTGDFYTSFVTPLIPVYVETFSLSLAQAGVITGLSRLLAFVVQPPVGYFADRYRTRVFVLGGPLLAVVFISLSGIVPSYPLLLLCVCLGSVGSAMFHPSTAGMVATYAGKHLGLSMSLFNMGGTAAFGLGPLFIALFVGAYGLNSMPLTMLLGLILIVVLIKTVPAPLGEGLTGMGFFGSLREVLGDVWKQILLIMIVMMLRAAVGQSFLTFIPLLCAERGFSLVEIGAVVSIFTIMGAISGVIAGHSADRFGYMKIFLIAHGLSTPSLILLLFLPGKWLYLGSALAGFFLMATLPLGVAMAQELAPRGRSMVSSLMMGFALGMGGTMTIATGSLADMFSIRSVLFVLAFIPLCSMGLIARFPGPDSSTRS